MSGMSALGSAGLTSCCLVVCARNEGWLDDVEHVEHGSVPTCHSELDNPRITSSQNTKVREIQPPRGLSAPNSHITSKHLTVMAYRTRLQIVARTGLATRREISSSIPRLAADSAEASTSTPDAPRSSLVDILRQASPGPSKTPAVKDASSAPGAGCKSGAVGDSGVGVGGAI
jgi:hypothetical protein